MNSKRNNGLSGWRPAIGITAAAISIGQVNAASARPPTVIPTDAADQTLHLPESSEIVVTGTRIDSKAFDAPTPTTIVDAIDLRQGNRRSIAQVLNDLPAFRATRTPTNTGTNTNNSFSPVDLRGLGILRTLTLEDGHRFVGALDLNAVPQDLVEKVEVVTGGASAAWGSGAVAGVVNIILKRNFEGLSLGTQSGISSRGDGMRYGFDATYGTKFAGGRGHFETNFEYLKEDGIFDRNDGSRPNIDTGLFAEPNGQLLIARNVNSLSATTGGVIASGPLAGMAFNSDGSLSPAPKGSQSNANQTIGGSGHALADYRPVSSPYQRFNTNGRLDFELNNRLHAWANFSFTAMSADFRSFPETANATASSGGIVLSSTNPYLTASEQAALAPGGSTFRLGRIFGDPGGYQDSYYQRQTYEGAVGVEGTFGETWKYSAYYDHGELHNHQGFYNQRITANFLNAIDAVLSPSGQIVCRVSLTDPTTACRPLNLFGAGNASQAATSYVFATKSQVYAITTQSLDAGGFSVSGDLFEGWAGPLSVAFGSDSRRESFVTNSRDPLTTAKALAGFNFANENGSFYVEEGFAEAAFPLFDVTSLAKLDINGAARYSNYSTSGGIWAWKGGGTLRFMNGLLLRAVYSRDIRSPSVDELFLAQTTSYATVADPFHANQSAFVLQYGGGNSALKPEKAHTLTLGGSYSPRFARGLNLSIDYYNINIAQAIGQIAPQDALNQCYNGNTLACAAITRDSSGSIVSILGTYINLASLRTRGVDFEASYNLPLKNLNSRLPGTLTIHGFATYVSSFVVNNGVTVVNYAGSVGDNTSYTVPKWKASATISYQLDSCSLDNRIRFVGGGLFDVTSNIINNKVAGRAYLDIGAQCSVGHFTLYGTVNNAFDQAPPFILGSGSAIYDSVGRYFSIGAKLRF